MEKIIKISGMACDHCKSAVEKGLRALDGVSDVAVSLEENTARVTLAKEIDNEILCRAVYDLGFDAEI